MNMVPKAVSAMLLPHLREAGIPCPDKPSDTMLIQTDAFFFPIGCDDTFFYIGKVDPDMGPTTVQLADPEFLKIAIEEVLERWTIIRRKEDYRLLDMASNWVHSHRWMISDNNLNRIYKLSGHSKRVSGWSSTPEDLKRCIKNARRSLEVYSPKHTL